MAADELLFSYGMLKRPDVQLDTFGRILDSEDDVLPGYKLEYVEVEDERVIEVSGETRHPIVRPTGSSLDKVVGKLLRVTEDELDAADEYQAALYRRASVVLASGRTAWVYVAN